MTAESASGPSDPSARVGPLLPLPYLTELSIQPNWQGIDWTNLTLPVTVTSAAAEGTSAIELAFRWSGPGRSDVLSSRIVQPGQQSFTLDLSSVTYGMSVSLSHIWVESSAGRALYNISDPMFPNFRSACPPGPFPPTNHALVCGNPGSSPIASWQYNVTAPPAPAITGAEFGVDTVTVTWSAIRFLAPYTGFTVTASPGDHTCSLFGLDMSAPLPSPMTCRLTGLTAGVSYSLSVRAHTPLGDTASSSPLPFVLPGLPTPGPTPTPEPTPEPRPTPEPTPAPGDGAGIVQGDPVEAERLAVRRPASDRPQGAPTIRIAQGESVSLVVRGLPKGLGLRVATRQAGSWVALGRARTTAKGLVSLPPLEARAPGDYVLRMTFPGGRHFFVSLRVAGPTT